MLVWKQDTDEENRKHLDGYLHKICSIPSGKSVIDSLIN